MTAPPLFKKLDRYLLAHFFTALLVIVISCLILFVLINMVMYIF